MMNWPTQQQVLSGKSIFGDPSAPGWAQKFIIGLTPPFPMHMGNIPITKIQVNKQCSDSLLRVLGAVYLAEGKDLAKLRADHIDEYSGMYAPRNMRGLSTRSMHAYGIAIDFDAEDNQLGSQRHFFTEDHPLVKAFLAEGWEWGGHWPTRPDAMHFQATQRV